MAFSAPSNDIELLGPDKGSAYSFSASNDVTAGQVVKIDSDNGVTPSDTDGEEVIGVATQTVSSGDQVMVAGIGSRVRLTAGTSTVSAGDKLTSHGSSGDDGVVDTGDATGDFVLGMAHEGVSSSGDTFVATLTLAGEVN